MAFVLKLILHAELQILWMVPVSDVMTDISYLYLEFVKKLLNKFQTLIAHNGSEEYVKNVVSVLPLTIKEDAQFSTANANNMIL